MTAVKIVIPVPTTSSRKLAELSGISQHDVVELKSTIAKGLYLVSQPFKENPGSEAGMTAVKIVIPAGIKKGRFRDLFFGYGVNRRY